MELNVNNTKKEKFINNLMNKNNYDRNNEKLEVIENQLLYSFQTKKEKKLFNKLNNEFYTVKIDLNQCDGIILNKKKNYLKFLGVISSNCSLNNQIINKNDLNSIILGNYFSEDLIKLLLDKGWGYIYGNEL